MMRRRHVRTAARIDPLERRQLLSAVPAATALAEFNGTDGSAPAGGVYADAAGDLFGVATAGGTGTAAGGTLWELPAGSTALRVLAAFSPTGQPDPAGGVVADAAGDLYGTFVGDTDYEGVVHTHGGVWEYARSTGTLATLATFDGADGDDPDGTPAIDARGDLFGVAKVGGAAAYDGTLWELPAGSATLRRLVSFDPSVEDTPVGRVALDAAGDVFGAARGAVWELPAGSSALTVRASLGAGSTTSGTLGEDASTGLTGDGAGHFYGATFSGGANGFGSLYKLDPTASPPTVTPLAPLDDDTGSVDGELTVAGGAVYGIAGTISNQPDGVVFRLAPGGTVQVVASVPGSGLNAPVGPMVVTAAGDLVGLAENGGDAGDAANVAAEGDGGLFDVPAADLAAAAATPHLAFAKVPATFSVLNTTLAPDRDTYATYTVGTVVVDVDDAAGHPLAGDGSTVTLSFAAGGDGLTLGATATAVNGVATFPDLQISNGGNFNEVPIVPFRLLATAGGDLPAASSVVDVGSQTSQTLLGPTPTPTGTLSVSVGRTTVPAAVVAGAAVRRSVRVTAANTATTATAGPEHVTVYATQTGAVDSASVAVGTVPLGRPLRPGRRATAAVPVRTAALAAGTYTLLAVVADATGATSAAASVGTLTVAPAAVSLSAAVARLAPTTVLPGRSTVVTFTVANAGNVAATGSATLSVQLVAGGTAVATSVRPLTVRPGRSVTVRLRFRVPDGIAPGAYAPVVSVVRDGVSTTATAGPAALTVA